MHWGDQLLLTVSDDGQGSRPGGARHDGRPPGQGRGLLGLRERLALYGGELAAGPRPDGGWRVRAVLPLTGPDARVRRSAGSRTDRRSDRQAGSGASAGDTGQRPLTVVIADDQALVRGGFRLILKAAGINVAAEAADGAQAVAAVLEHRPDVVLMDVRMPVMDGIEATRRSWRTRPGGDARRPAIIILTTFDLDEYVYAALGAGASGFLLKDVTPGAPGRRGPAGPHRRRAARPVDHPPPG